MDEDMRMVLTVLDEISEDARQKGRHKGRHEAFVEVCRGGILNLLDARFGEVSDDLRMKIEGENDVMHLENLLRHAAKSASIESFRAELPDSGQMDSERKDDGRSLWEHFFEEGREEGRLQVLRKGVMKLLDFRFGEAPQEIREMLETIHDEGRLQELNLRAAKARSLEAFRVAM
jgi:transcriptional regulator of heat shock response